MKNQTIEFQLLPIKQRLSKSQKSYKPQQMISSNFNSFNPFPNLIEHNFQPMNKVFEEKISGEKNMNNSAKKIKILEKCSTFHHKSERFSKIKNLLNPTGALTTL